MTIATGIQYIAVEDLYLHPLNPRQSVPDGDTDLMAATLDAAGLIQNLVGVKDPASDGGVGIVDGGRRLRALKELAQAGLWDRKVPVVVTRSVEDALTAAAAAAEAHLPLSPAQEIRLYAGLVQDDRTPADIARAHGVTEKRVQQRLRLARLPAAVLDALEAREISIDMAQAFSVSDDEEAIGTLLDHVKGRQISATWVRDELTNNAVSADDFRAVYVGEAAYLDAGGTITPDLFAPDHWHDEKVLDKLFQAALTAEAAKIKEEEGWADVRPAFRQYGPEWSMTSGLHTIYPTPVELPAGDQAELDELDAAEDLDDAQRARQVELEARARGDYSDEEVAKAIIFVWIDRDAKLQRTDAYLEKKPRAKAESAGKIDAKEDDAPGLSQALREDLNRIATAAFQAALIEPDNRAIVLAIAAHEGEVMAWQSVSGLSISEPSNSPSEASGLDLPGAITDTGLDTIDKPDAAKVIDMGQEAALDRLQVQMARGCSARFDEYGRGLMAAAKIDIRAHWTPNAANFFGRCRPKYLEALFSDLLPNVASETLDAFKALKKAEKAEAMERLFALDQDLVRSYGLDGDDQLRIEQWLPAEIRITAEATP